MGAKIQIAKALNRLGVGATKKTTLEYLKATEISYKALITKLELVGNLTENSLSKTDSKNLTETLKNSKSQLGQDLLALAIADFSHEGYFVEFGATNGVNMSNTFVLEKLFGWRGILAEPAKSWHSELLSNRTCHIETQCVWKHSNEKIIFNETEYLEISTIDSFSAGDMHTSARANGKRYDVSTISLLDLLTKFSAPRVIDYLSIDTEGSELEILQTFDFNKFKFNFISCEHNFTSNREIINQLLSQHGYARVLANKSRFDDWYVPSDLAKSKGFI